jgi:hypothetical protein
MPSEKELAERFGVGRPSVRQALFTLQQQGLVEITSGARARVTAPSGKFLVGQMGSLISRLTSTGQGQEHMEQTRLLLEAGVAWQAARVATRRGHPPAQTRSTPTPRRWKHRRLHPHRCRLSRGTCPLLAILSSSVCMMRWSLADRPADDDDQHARRDRLSVGTIPQSTKQSPRASDAAFLEVSSHLRLISELYRESKRLEEILGRRATWPEESNASGIHVDTSGPGDAVAGSAKQEEGRTAGSRSDNDGELSPEPILDRAPGERDDDGGSWRGRRGVGAGLASPEVGHDVVLIERQAEAAMETSWGNGGIIHASEVEPWSQPGMPAKIIRWLGKEDAPLLLRYRAIPQMFGWGLAFARNCTPERFRENALSNLHLALHSLRSLQEIGAETGIAYDRATRGVLKIYRSKDALDNAERSSGFLAQYGLRSSASRGDALRSAGARHTASSLAARLYFARDEVGDSNSWPRPCRGLRGARRPAPLRRECPRH